MESQKAINVEKLIPSTLLEDDRSDVENVSNENYKQDDDSSKGEPENNKHTEQVSHFYKFYFL